MMWTHCSKCGNPIIHFSEYGVSIEKGRLMKEMWKIVKHLIVCRDCFDDLTPEEIKKLEEGWEEVKPKLKEMMKEDSKK